jgi:hypothetical protein
MAFPWLFEENFELGTKGDFDSETDTDNRLDFAGPADLAGDGLGVAPYRGAYVIRVNMSKSNTDAYVEDAAFGVSLGTTRWLRHYLMLSDDFTMSDGDVVNIFGVYSSGPTFEMGVGIMRKDPDGVVLVAQNAIAHTGGPFIKIVPGAGPASKSSTSLMRRIPRLGCTLTATRCSRPASPPARSLLLGLGPCLRPAISAATYIGIRSCSTISACCPSPKGRWTAPTSINATLTFTKSGFAFVGSGEILEVQAIDNGSDDARVKVFDADTPKMIAEYDKRIDRRFDNHLRLQPTNFLRGAFVQLSGTNPQALVRVGKVNEFGLEDAAVAAPLSAQDTVEPQV